MLYTNREAGFNTCLSIFYTISLQISHNIIFTLFEHLNAFIHITRPDNDISLISLCKSIHILNEYLIIRQTLQNFSQCPRFVMACNIGHIGKHNCEIFGSQNLGSLFNIRYYKSQNTEIGRFGHTKCMHIDTMLTQGFCNLIDSSSLVLQKNR